MTRRKVRAVRADKATANLLQKIRVPLGFAFAAFYAVFSQPIASRMWPGIALAALGLLFRLWATGYLRKHQELCISGPYRHTRNPLYLGSFLVGIGFSVAAANHWILLIFLLLFFAVYAPVMRKEERELLQAYGTPYEEYQRAVPHFLPSLHPYRSPATRNFSWKQLILNREYNAVLGFLTVCVFLLVKLMWL